jgi:hypothetical protein
MEFYVITDSGPAAIKAASDDPRVRYGAMLWEGGGFIAGTADDLTNLPPGRVLIGQERAFWFPYKVKRLDPTGTEHFALVGFERIEELRSQISAASDVGRFALVQTEAPVEGYVEWSGTVASWRTSVAVEAEVEAFVAELDKDA